MRLFIAVNFDNETKKHILAVQDRIKKGCLGGRFSPPENLHLTLVFLGETGEGRIPELKEAMEEINSPLFELSFSHVVFTRRGNRELWRLETDKNGASLAKLNALQMALASDLAERGFHIDRRPYSAHITLGRDIQGGPRPFSIKAIAVPIRRISLMLSEQKPSLKNPGKKDLPDEKFHSGSVYTEIFGVNLEAV